MKPPAPDGSRRAGRVEDLARAAVLLLTVASAGVSAMVLLPPAGEPDRFPVMMRARSGASPRFGSRMGMGGPATCRR